MDDNIRVALIAKASMLLGDLAGLEEKLSAEGQSRDDRVLVEGAYKRIERLRMRLERARATT
jgi:hypothetical protein